MGLRDASASKKFLETGEKNKKCLKMGETKKRVSRNGKTYLFLFLDTFGTRRKRKNVFSYF